MALERLMGAGVKGAARHGFSRLPLTPATMPLRSQNGGRLWAALAGCSAIANRLRRFLLFVACRPRSARLAVAHGVLSGRSPPWGGGGGLCSAAGKDKIPVLFRRRGSLSAASAHDQRSAIVYFPISDRRRRRDGGSTPPERGDKTGIIVRAPQPISTIYPILFMRNMAVRSISSSIIIVLRRPNVYWRILT